MNPTTAWQLLSDSHSEFITAQNELNRPKEDVVSYTVCTASKHFLNALLKVYLLNGSVNYKNANAFLDLIDLCSKHDKYFQSFDLSPLICRCENLSESDTHYCLSAEKTKACIMLVEKIKKYVFSHIGIAESES